MDRKDADSGFVPDLFDSHSLSCHKFHRVNMVAKCKCHRALFMLSLFVFCRLFKHTSAYSSPKIHVANRAIKDRYRLWGICFRLRLNISNNYNLKETVKRSSKYKGLMK